MPRPTSAEWVAQAWRDARGLVTAVPSLHTRPLAIGWATVELDRAIAELTAALRLPGEAFGAASRSDLLGGVTRVAEAVLPDGGSLVVLEPDTEGRLAASLARLDEGPVAVWLAVDAPGPRVEALRAAGIEVSPERVGPFGVERLLLGGPAKAPGLYRLLVVRSAGTIPP